MAGQRIVVNCCNIYIHMKMCYHTNTYVCNHGVLTQTVAYFDLVK